MLALILLVSACAKDEMAIAAITELDTLTDDIVATVAAAEDKRAGVAEAQAKLDAKRAELGPKMEEVLGLRGFQVNEETKKRVETGLIDNTLKMVSLEADLLIATMNDPELRAALDKLTGDYEALLDGK
jgi:hypothetical protein